MDHSVVRDQDFYIPPPSDAYYETDDIFDLELNDSISIGSPGFVPFGNLPSLTCHSREPPDQALEALAESSDTETASVGSPVSLSSVISHSTDQDVFWERRSSWRENPRSSRRLSHSLDEPSSEEEFIGSPGKAPRHARRGSLGPFGAAAIFLGVCFGTIGLAKIAKHGPATLPHFEKCEGGICSIPGANF